MFCCRRHHHQAALARVLPLTSPPPRAQRRGQTRRQQQQRQQQWQQQRRCYSHALPAVDDGRVVVPLPPPTAATTTITTTTTATTTRRMLIDPLPLPLHYPQHRQPNPNQAQEPPHPASCPPPIPVPFPRARAVAASPSVPIASKPPSSKFQLFTKSHIRALFARYVPRLDPEPYVAAAQVFPMRINNYVADNLIDWSNIPNDPYFQLVFPQPGMLTPNELGRITAAMNHPATSRVKLRMLAESIRANLNPHPSNQKQENVPLLDGAKVPGMQHKYRETVLFFPTEGQFCHSFCTYCFRWAQFTSVGSGQQFQSKDAETLQRYVAQHKSTKDILFTGGDPMVMSAVLLRRYIAPLLHNPDTAHLQTIRIGTKSLAYWPYRYLTDPDAKDVLKLFEDVAKSGKHLAVQAHFSHPRELENPVVAEAIRAIRMTGAQIRCQSPLIRHVNDDPDVWAHMWELQTRLGLIPYYMFIERDTGAKSYFSVPLTAAFSLFSNAYSRLSGLARTVRGPIMSASPGKVAVVGTQAIHGEKVIVLKFFQSRDPAWLDRLFFATWNEKASWLDELDPAFGEEKWFWEEGYRGIAERGRAGEGSSGQMFG